jgi:hypothetical protein
LVWHADDDVGVSGPEGGVQYDAEFLFVPDDELVLQGQRAVCSILIINVDLTSL